MTLYEFVHRLENIALNMPNVRSAGHNKLYDFMANPEVEYRVFYVTQNQHQSYDNFDVYNVNLFIIDRLLPDYSNELEIQSAAKTTLDNIVEKFCDLYNSEIVGGTNTRKYSPFTEKFNSLTAGMFLTIKIEVPKDIVCAE